MYTPEEFDQAKTRILKYIMFKKRTEAEVKTKFQNQIEENMLEDCIEYLKEAGYINDYEYIEKQVQEYMKLKNLSIKEIKYKLYAKGIAKNIIEEYIENNLEELQEYENQSKENIKNKKSAQMTEEEIRNYLYKKGYYE